MIAPMDTGDPPGMFILNVISVVVRIFITHSIFTHVFDCYKIDILTL
jgi:hypothetical protein